MQISSWGNKGTHITFCYLLACNVTDCWKFIRDNIIWDGWRWWRWKRERERDRGTGWRSAYWCTNYCKHIVMHFHRALLCAAILPYLPNCSYVNAVSYPFWGRYITDLHEMVICCYWHCWWDGDETTTRKVMMPRRRDERAGGSWWMAPKVHCIIFALSTEV